MKLEVGEFYLTEDGRIIEITYFDNEMFLDKDDYFYSEDGVNDEYVTNRNLIAHIPKQLHYELLRVVNEYHTNKDFKSMIDINFEKRKVNATN